MQKNTDQKKSVFITSETHKRLRSMSKITGMKIESLADKYVSMGLSFDERDTNTKGASK